MRIKNILPLFFSFVVALPIFAAEKPAAPTADKPAEMVAPAPTTMPDVSDVKVADFCEAAKKISQRCAKKEKSVFAWTKTDDKDCRDSLSAIVLKNKEAVVSAIAAVKDCVKIKACKDAGACLLTTMKTLELPEEKK